MPLCNKIVMSQLHQSQIRHQSCPSLPNVAHSISLALPKSCPTSAAVSPNSSQQLLLPMNQAANTPSNISSSKNSCLLQPVPIRHSLHPLSGKERTPSSSFSTRVIVSRTPVTSSHKKFNEGDISSIPISTNPNYENTIVVTTPITKATADALMQSMATFTSSPECDKDISYENVNMDYISRLIGEGYAQELVVRALGITRNDIDMARDILHEFVSLPQERRKL